MVQNGHFKIIGMNRSPLYKLHNYKQHSSCTVRSSFSTGDRSGVAWVMGARDGLHDYEDYDDNSDENIKILSVAYMRVK